MNRVPRDEYFPNTLDTISFCLKKKKKKNYSIILLILVLLSVRYLEKTHRVYVIFVVLTSFAFFHEMSVCVCIVIVAIGLSTKTRKKKYSSKKTKRVQYANVFVIASATVIKRFV